MGINIGEVEAVLAVRDSMSPKLVEAAQKVVDLRTKLGELTQQFNQFSDAESRHTEAYRTLSEQFTRTNRELGLAENQFKLAGEAQERAAQSAAALAAREEILAEKKAATTAATASQTAATNANTASQEASAVAAGTSAARLAELQRMTEVATQAARSNAGATAAQVTAQNLAATASTGGAAAAAGFGSAVAASETSIKSATDRVYALGSALFSAQASTKTTGAEITKLKGELDSATINLGAMTSASTAAATRQSAMATAAAMGATGVKQVGVEAEDSAEKMNQMERMATRLIERMIILYALRAAAGFLYDLFEFASVLEKLNSTSGLTLSKLQELAYGADRLGIPFEKVDAAITTLDRNLAGVKATAGDALLNIGLSFSKIFAMSPDERFEAIAAAINRLPSQLQRSQAEIAIFGTDAIDPLIKKLSELEKAAHDSNAVLGDETVHAMASTIEMWRHFLADLKPIAENIVDVSQRVVAALAAPFVTAYDWTVRGDKHAVGEPGGRSPWSWIADLTFNPLGTIGSVATDIYGYTTRPQGALTGAGSFAAGGVPGVNMSPVTPPAAPSVTTGPPVGPDYIPYLKEQLASLKALEPYQRAGLEFLREHNMLSIQYATHLNVSTEQLKLYTDAMKDSDKAETSAAKSKAAFARIMADADAEIAASKGKDKETGTLQDRLNAIDMEVYKKQVAAQQAIGWTSYEWEAEYRIWEAGEAKKATLIDNEEKKINDKKERATSDSIARTARLWDQYEADVARVEEGSWAARIAQVDVWYDSQKRVLDRSKDLNDNYWNELEALEEAAEARRGRIRQQREDAEQKSLERLTVEWDQYYQAVEVESGTTVDVQIANVQRWFDSELKRLKDSDEFWADHYDVLYATAQQKVANIIHAQDPLWLAWKAGNEDMRREWASTWEKALDGTGSFVDALAAPFLDIEHMFVKMLAGMLSDWEQQLLGPMLASMRGVLGSLFHVSAGSTSTGFASSLPGSYPFTQPSAYPSYGPTTTNTWEGGQWSSTPYMPPGGPYVRGYEPPPTFGASALSGVLTGAGAAASGGSVGHQLATEAMMAASVGVSVAMAAGGTIAAGMVAGAVTMGIGAAVIGGIALLHNALRDHTPADVARDASVGFGQKWSADLIKSISDLAKTRNTGMNRGKDEQAAELLSLPAIVAEHPIDSSNIDMYTGKVHDLFSMVEIGHMSIAEATTTLDAVFPKLAAAATDSYGRINNGLREIINLNEIFGTQSKEIAAWRKGQSSDIIGGVTAEIGALPITEWDKIAADIEKAMQAQTDPKKQDELKVLKGKVDDAQAAYDRMAAKGESTPDQLAAAQAKVDIAKRNLRDASPDLATAVEKQAEARKMSGQDVADLSIQAIGAYEVARGSGKSEIEAIKEESKGLTDLQKAYKDLGIDVEDTGLRHLFILNTVITKNPALLAGVDGLSKAVVGFDNLGKETKEMFEAQERTGLSMWERVKQATIDAGGTTEDALGLMQGWLHTAADEAERLGVKLDDGTQALIDQSKDAGVWQDKIKPKPDLISAVGDLTSEIHDLVNALLGIPPERHTKVVVDTEYTEPTGPAKPPGPTGPGPLPGPKPGPGDPSRPQPAADGVYFPESMGTPGVDSIPVWVAPGEAIIPHTAVRALGIDRVNALINAKGYARGGIVGSGVPVDTEPPPPATGQPPTFVFDPDYWESGLYSVIEGLHQFYPPLSGLGSAATSDGAIKSGSQPEYDHLMEDFNEAKIGNPKYPSRWPGAGPNSKFLGPLTGFLAQQAMLWDIVEDHDLYGLDIGDGSGNDPYVYDTFAGQFRHWISQHTVDAVHRLHDTSISPPFLASLRNKYSSEPYPYGYFYAQQLQRGIQPQPFMWWMLPELAALHELPGYDYDIPTIMPSAKAPTYAAFGSIVSDTGSGHPLARGTDTQSYMLTPGEAVLPVDVVQALGESRVRELISGRYPRPIGIEQTSTPTAGSSTRSNFPLSGASSSSTAAPPHVTNIYNVENNINAIDAKSFKDLVEEEGMPVIVDKLENDNRGYLSRISHAQKSMGVR